MSKFQSDKDIQSNITQKVHIKNEQNHNYVKNFAIGVRIRPLLKNNNNSQTNKLKYKIKSILTKNNNNLNQTKEYTSVISQRQLISQAKQLQLYSQNISSQQSINKIPLMAFGKSKKFIYDSIFDQQQTTNQIFQSTIKKKLNLLKEGYHVSLMAYGTTGSGKTYTIFGNSNSMINNDNINTNIEDKNNSIGISYLSCQYLYEQLLKGYQFSMSYLQIYNQTIQDLLISQPQGQQILIKNNLQIYQDQKGKVIIPGLKIKKINSLKDIFQLINQGNKKRKSSSTYMNQSSSRSHAILQLYCKDQKLKINVKLTVIDLAGSQKHQNNNSLSGLLIQDQILHRNIQNKEGSNINKSLLTLGNCIQSLQKQENYIPYRNSKLTRILKQNFQGKSHNFMIACVHFDYNQFEQTINTLYYAQRVANIKTVIQPEGLISDQNQKICLICKNNILSKNIQQNKENINPNHNLNTKRQLSSKRKYLNLKELVKIELNNIQDLVQNNLNNFYQIGQKQILNQIDQFKNNIIKKVVLKKEQNQESQGQKVKSISKIQRKIRIPSETNFNSTIRSSLQKTKQKKNENNHKNLHLKIKQNSKNTKRQNQYQLQNKDRNEKRKRISSIVLKIKKFGQENQNTTKINKNSNKINILTERTNKSLQRQKYKQSYTYREYQNQDNLNLFTKKSKNNNYIQHAPLTQRMNRDQDQSNNNSTQKNNYITITDLNNQVQNGNKQNWRNIFLQKTRKSISQRNSLNNSSNNKKITDFNLLSLHSINNSNEKVVNKQQRNKNINSNTNISINNFISNDLNNWKAYQNKIKLLKNYKRSQVYIQDDNIIQEQSDSQLWNSIKIDYHQQKHSL